ncbi:MerR family transcriptional regulator [Brachybacterium conglomeratum]|uniref:MerR family transcriptional regulator n=1 Tax=Brachybacterium conglomeratum TaxID=47846 RepID=UPI003DA19309
MRISALSARTEVPIGTIKFYLREGLLAPGRQTSRTTAEYDESHVERIRLVRALTDAGGLGIAAVRRIVEVLDAPGPARLDLLATAQHALLADEPVPTAPTGPTGRTGADGPDGVDGADGVDEADEVDGADDPDVGGAPAAGAADEADAASPAREWLSRRGWHTYGDDLLVARLERVWAACEAAGIQLDDELMDGYAEALEQVARLDVDTVPEDPDEAVRRVVVGTVMLEPVLLTLRLLAQRELSVRRAETVDGGRLRTDLRR